MNTKIILMNRDGTKAGEIPEISYDRVMNSGIIMHVDTFFTFSYKIQGENAYQFTEAGPLCVVDDSEVVCAISG